MLRICISYFVLLIGSVLLISGVLILHDQPTSQFIYTHSSPYVVLIQGGNSDEQCKGSGFLVNYHNQLVVVTAAHVVSDPTLAPYSVTIQGRTLSIASTYISPTQDIAILTLAGNITGTGLTFSTTKPHIGDHVYSVGYPQDHKTLFFTEGIVNGFDYDDKPNYLSVSSDFTEGDSGGPILNSMGQVVGIIDCLDINAEFLRYGIPSSVIQHDINNLTKQIPTLDLR